VSRFEVVGNPVSHSKSPIIHQAFARQTGIELDYSAMELAEPDFESGVQEFFAAGGKGLNVTVPFKERAFRLARSYSPLTAMAKAANTLFLDAAGEIAADNTDGKGLLMDLAHHDISLTNKRVLVIGAGGAVRGVLAAMVDTALDDLVIVNRTPERARQLATEFGSVLPMQVLLFEELGKTNFDVIINGTSLSLVGELPPLSNLVLGPNCCCYDMMYADKPTVFQTWALEAGAGLALDGLGMLVEQAAESFAIWHGVRPETKEVISHLRS